MGSGRLVILRTAGVIRPSPRPGERHGSSPPSLDNIIIIVAKMLVAIDFVYDCVEHCDFTNQIWLGLLNIECKLNLKLRMFYWNSGSERHEIFGTFFGIKTVPLQSIFLAYG